MPDTSRSPRLDPLPPEHSPELKEEFDSFFKTLGFVPNSVLTMQRKPKLAKAFVQMQRALWDPESKVDRGLKRLVVHRARPLDFQRFRMGGYMRPGDVGPSLHQFARGEALFGESIVDRAAEQCG